MMASFLSKIMFQQRFNISGIYVMQYNSIITSISSCFYLMHVNEQKYCKKIRCSPKVNRNRND